MPALLALLALLALANSAAPPTSGA